jgi:hypothetical protein
MFRKTHSIGLLLVATGCAHPPPPHWADGGAPLQITSAHWERADDEPVEIDVQGRVFEGTTLRFVIDRVGRVTDDEGEPVAMLFPAGEVVGPSNQYLGRVGVANAAPPHGDQAWVAVMPDGVVTRFADDGERSSDGRWQGCEGAHHRTCTLVTHLILLRHYNSPRPRVSVGVGVMMPL